LDEERNLGHWQMERNCSFGCYYSSDLIVVHQHQKTHSAAVLKEEEPEGPDDDDELEALVHHRHGRAPYRFSKFNLLLYNEDTMTIFGGESAGSQTRIRDTLDRWWSCISWRILASTFTPVE
jgi:hypothetical protein